MDILELGAIGELVAGVALVAFFLFVGAQIRKQTQEKRLAATRELSAQFNQSLAPLVEDPTMSKLWRKAVRDYDTLDGDDRLRVALFLDRHKRAYEQHDLHVNHLKIGPAYSESITRQYAEGLSFSGVSRWWELNRRGFSSRFRQHVDNLAAGSESRETTKGGA